MYSRSIDHAGGSATQSIQLPNAVAKGIYQLLISNGDMKTTQHVVVE